MQYDSFLAWLRASNNDIFINLFSGLLSAAIVLSLQTSVRVTSFVVRDVLLGRYRLKRLFGFSITGAPIHVVSGSLRLKTSMVLGGDAKAASGIAYSIESVFRPRLVSHAYTGRNAFDHLPQSDLVAVGGPVNNGCSKELMLDYEWLVRFDENDDLIIHDGRRKLAGAKSNSVAGEDFGFVLRVTNPASPKHKALVIAGCGSHAVYAAALLLVDSGRFPHLRSEFRAQRGLRSRIRNEDFVAVVRCKFRSGEVHSVHIDGVYPTVRRVQIDPSADNASVH